MAKMGLLLILTAVLLTSTAGCRTVAGVLFDSLTDRDRSVRGRIDEPGISARERRARFEDDRLRDLTSDRSWNSAPSSWNSD